MDSLEFFISSANHFTSLFLIWMFFIWLELLKMGIVDFFLFGGRKLSVTTECDVRCGIFINVLFHFEEVPFYSQFVKCFLSEKSWILLNAFLYQIRRSWVVFVCMCCCCFLPSPY